MSASRLDPQRYLPPEGAAHALSVELYESVAGLPLLCPHGHIDAASFVDPGARLDPPGSLLVTSDHYVLRLLYAHGVQLERLGVRPRDGGAAETDDRAIWRLFCDHLHVFAGTPVKLWLNEMLAVVFGIDERLSADNANRVYDELEARLASPDFAPRSLLDRFGIETLATTDPAGSTLESHSRLREQGFGDRIRPTFRPDAVVDISAPGWRDALGRLEAAADFAIGDYATYLEALVRRREAFAALGATATDHGAMLADTTPLDTGTAAAIFGRALAGAATADEARQFGAHMLTELARMSVDDGLVMQLHIGSLRDHDAPLAQRFGTDIGADIPIAIDWTRGLRPLLNAYGSERAFRVIVFTLDESTYGRELAPLAGHYPGLIMGPPWWFLDSPEGMTRYLSQVTETAGIYKLAGFVDDARLLPSIPVRHDLWRRLSCAWLAGRVVAGVLEEGEARSLAWELAYGLAQRAYRLGGAAS